MVAEADTDHAVGGIGLSLTQLPGGRATAGYSVASSARGRGIAAAALSAVTSFGLGLALLEAGAATRVAGFLDALIGKVDVGVSALYVACRDFDADDGRTLIALVALTYSSWPRRSTWS